MSETKNTNKSPNKDKKKVEKNNPGQFYWLFAVIILVLILLTFFSDGTSTKNIQKRKVVEMIENGDVEEIIVVDNLKIAEITLTQDAIQKDEYQKMIKKPLIGNAGVTGPHFSYTYLSEDAFEEDLEEWKKINDFDSKVERREDWGRNMLSWVFFLVIMMAVWIFVMRKISGGGAGAGSQIFNIGKSRARIFDKEKSTNVTFEDVAGLEGAKEEIKEIVDFLKSPDKYTKLGAKIPRGALLVGPPGTGKTLLAKAVAGEARVPFFSLSGSDFVEMFVGVGASRVRDLFKQAKEKAPSIIFIDEIDAIGRARGKNASMGSNDERENTLNQLLTEMDGFGTNNGVIILAATNRAEILDTALMRAGRFDRQIYVDIPDLNERKAIFKVHLKPLVVDESIDINFLARQTPGFSGADIANMCNEAALIAARSSKEKVTKDDFLSAVDRIIGGLEKKNKIITPKEKEVIAFHEAGHATVSWLVEHASPLIKVTIVPRGKSLGAAWYLPEERQITTTEQLLDEMAATMGGRAAEQIIFGKISTGALSDLEKVTKQAHSMVTVYGMDEEVGNLSYYDSSGQSDYSFSKPYSDKTAELIDRRVRDIIETAYARAKKILSDNKDKLTELAHKLVEEEVIFKEDLESIFGKKLENSNSAIVLDIANKPNAREQQIKDDQDKRDLKNDPPETPKTAV